MGIDIVEEINNANNLKLSWRWKLIVSLNYQTILIPLLFLITHQSFGTFLKKNEEKSLF